MTTEQYIELAETVTVPRDEYLDLVRRCARHSATSDYEALRCRHAGQLVVAIEDSERGRRCDSAESLAIAQLEIAELREQVSLRDIAIMERDRLLNELREQGGSAAVANLRQQYNIALKRAQDAEGKVATAESRQRSAERARDGFREHNAKMQDEARDNQARIRELEAEVATSEAEFAALRKTQQGGGE